MYAAYRSGARPIQGIPETKKKRYKITCPGKSWKLQGLSRPLFMSSHVLPLRYKISSPHNLPF